MNALPLRWWSRAALDAAAAALAPAWSAWGTGWDIAADPVVATNAFEQTDDERLRMRWHRCVGDAAWLGSNGAMPVELIGRLLFGDAERPGGRDPGSLATEVAEAAWADLLVAVGSALPALRGGAAGWDPVAAAATAEAETSPPAAGWRPWSGAVTIRFGIAAPDGPAFVLHLSAPRAATLLAAHAPPATKPMAMPRLEPVERAFGHRSIRVRVELAELQLELGVLQSLRTGDVLALQHRLDEPLRLCLPRRSLSPGADPALCPALLGSRDGRRAVELIRDPTHA